MSNKSALIIVDFQNDFRPGGALAAETADTALPGIRDLAKEADFVVATRDWHPEGHCSFSDDPKFEDKSWPPHCVQDTPGADLHPDVEGLADMIISKGTDKDKEAYSGFEGVIDDGSLTDWLSKRDVDTVTVAGLVTEFCVKATAIDAMKEGFRTTVNTHAIASLGEDTGEAALKEMIKAGVRVSDRIPRGDREATREQGISEAIEAIAIESEEADANGNEELVEWYKLLIDWLKGEVEGETGRIVITFPSAFLTVVRTVEIPEAQVAIGT